MSFSIIYLDIYIIQSFAFILTSIIITIVILLVLSIYSLNFFNLKIFILYFLIIFSKTCSFHIFEIICIAWITTHKVINIIFTIIFKCNIILITFFFCNFYMLITGWHTNKFWMFLFEFFIFFITYYFRRIRITILSTHSWRPPRCFLVFNWSTIFFFKLSWCKHFL